MLTYIQTQVAAYVNVIMEGELLILFCSFTVAQLFPPRRFWYLKFTNFYHFCEKLSVPPHN